MYEVYYVRLYCITIIRYNTEPRLATLGAVLINTLLRFDALILNWSKKTSMIAFSRLYSLYSDFIFYFLFFYLPTTRSRRAVSASPSTASSFRACHTKSARAKYKHNRSS